MLTCMWVCVHTHKLNCTCICYSISFVKICWPLYSFLIAAVTNGQNFSGSKPYNVSILQAWRSEFQNQVSLGSGQASAGLVLSGGSEGRIHFLAFPSLQRSPAFLGSEPFPHITLTTSLLLLSCLLLLLWSSCLLLPRTLVIILDDPG